MLKNLSSFKKVVSSLNSSVKYDIEPYRGILSEINKVNLSLLSNKELKSLSEELIIKARDGVNLNELLVEAYSLVREVSRRVLGQYPFDTQVIAAIAIHDGKVAEMQTGEGKTLAAVMPAYLNALTGKGVHMLTFNDYLARRDCRWMGPIYEFLGLTVGYVEEGVDIETRKSAYSCDITYVTAKEAGFDYLRDFLCEDKDKLVHRSFNYCIVDEADSILIDEARIPLVIAGDVSETEESLVNLSKLVKGLRQGYDYETDQYGKNVYITDEGLLKIEKILGCDNLYDMKNLELLTKLNCALHADVLLERDKDYIVRNGTIELVDEFTGRIAENRHWPDNIHSAVEAKEGLISQSKGKIMGSIALQYFIKRYPKISGMTGTASAVSEELREFYGVDVIVIPTNKPCIRKNHPNLVFTHKEAKERALIAHIKKVHETGQPILIGTSSIEESEWLSRQLEKMNVSCQVLNAKNDEMEANIIARAGELSAVTVSTNMAGRGVDIKLGGVNEQDKEKVAALGGLYVIGTNCHESPRIDDQLRGRAGRQGDPGETRFYISLEDDLITKYEITKLIPKHYLPKRQETPIEDAVIRKEIARGQRIIQGYNSDLRRQLWKYSYIIEQQRQIIHQKRQDILMDESTEQLLPIRASERYFSLCSEVGEDVLRKVEKQITLYHINKSWADYLDYMAYIQEGIHLVAVGRKNPLDEFNRIAIETYEEMLENIEDEIISTFNNVEIKENGVNLEKEGIIGPSATWTYLMNDDPNQFNNIAFIAKAFTPVIKGTLFSLKSIYHWVLKRKA